MIIFEYWLMGVLFLANLAISAVNLIWRGVLSVRDFLLAYWEPLLLIAAVIAAFAGLIYACSYRRVTTVMVDWRRWSYTLAVKYDVSTTTLECSSRTICTDDGESRTCRTEESCSPVTRTTTYTRCEKTSQGEELPPILPEMPCRMQSGDYTREYLSYWVGYHKEEDTTPQAHMFELRLWEALQPGKSVKITQNVLRTVVDAQSVK